MKLFAKIVKNKKSFTIFAKNTIVNISQGSEYASELASKIKNVLFLN